MVQLTFIWVYNVCVCVRCPCLLSPTAARARTLLHFPVSRGWVYLVFPLATQALCIRNKNISQFHQNFIFCRNSSCTAGRFFTVWATKEALGKELQMNNSPWILLPWTCSLRSAASRQNYPQWGWSVSLAVTHLHFCTGGSLPWVIDVCGLLLFELNHIVLAQIQDLFREAHAASVRLRLHPAPFQNLGKMIFVCLTNRHSSQRNNVHVWGKVHQRKKQKV